MRTAIAIPVLAFLTLGVHPAAAGDWNSLGRVPKEGGWADAELDPGVQNEEFG